MRFLVVIPTFNRAHTLERAISSVLEQTHKDWHLLVIDDGSTDNTIDILRPYVGYTRFHCIKMDKNAGGVAVNNIGMARAIGWGFDAWVRLGSDDWFLPRKLELDAIALEDYGACFGPYRNNPESYGGELNGPCDARAMLLRGEFAASWANIAVRTDVLRAVRARHAEFVDSRLRNMEDYLFNVRLSRLSDIGWRGLSEDGSSVCVGAVSPEQVGFRWQPDARYNVGFDGASEAGAGGIDQRAVCRSDAKLTEEIRGEDHHKNYAVTDFERQSPRVLRLERAA